MSDLGKPYVPGLSLEAGLRSGIVAPVAEDAPGSDAPWSGAYNGLPVVGATKPMTPVDLKRLQLTGQFKSRLFKMWDEADKREFDRVMQYATLGAYTVRRRHDRYDDKNNGYEFWLEWVQLYAVPGPENFAAAPTR